MVAAIGVVDPLQDDLAPLVLEIHIDVRRLAPFLGDEALEQQVVALGVDGGDAQDVADRRVGGRAAALAEDVLAAGEADDRVHRQEVGGVFQGLDQPQLVAKDRLDLVRHALRVAPFRPFPGQALQRGLRGHAGRRDLVGILVLQLFQREAAAVGDLQGAGQGLGIFGEEAVHLFRRLQMAIGVAFPPEAQLVDGAAVTHAGDHVLQQPALGMVKQDVVGDDGLNAGLGRQVGKVVQAHGVARPAAQAERQIGAGREGRLEAPQALGADLVGLVGDQHRDQALGEVGQVRPVEIALGLAGAPLAQRQQAAEPGVGWPIGRVDQHAGAIHQVQPAANDQPDAGDLGGLVGAHDAGDRVAIDDGQGLDPAAGRLVEQVLAGAGPPQEREVRGRLQLDVAGGLRTAVHPNRPCRNQVRSPVAGCSPSPRRKTQKRSPASSSSWK